MKNASCARNPVWRAIWGGSLMVMAAATAQAKVTDSHGNEAYDSAAECDAAAAAGTARFYKPFTEFPPLKRAGEADVKVMRLGELPGYERGACDRGTGRRNDRDGVAGQLIGRWEPCAKKSFRRSLQP